MPEIRNGSPVDVGKRFHLIGLLAWVLLAGGMSAKGATDSTLRVNPASHDFGTVNRLGGEVQTTFMVQNQEDGPINIRRIWTS